MILCTLFDSNYLDKGLALYRSLCKVTKNFKLYIFAFDQCAATVLKDLKLRKAVIVSYDEIEDEDLKRLKKERTRAEFCWTCTPIIIEHVLKKYQETNCTYVDADMWFFGDPNVLYKEVLDAKCSVGIAPHRFKKDRYYYRYIESSGKYCVHFNTFLNNEQGLAVLTEWKKQCLECCTSHSRNGKFGDQKYIEEWPHKYDYVHELEHLGGGVAPWNVKGFQDIYLDKNKLWLIDNKGNKNQMIFYHYESIKYLSYDFIYLNIWREYDIPLIDDIFDLKNVRIKKYIYEPYFYVIEQIRRNLKKRYDISFEHMILDKQEAKKYFPNIKDGIAEWNHKRKNLFFNKFRKDKKRYLKI